MPYLLEPDLHEPSFIKAETFVCFCFLQGPSTMTAAELLVVHELANGVRERYITYKPTVFPSFFAFHTCNHFKLSLQ